MSNVETQGLVCPKCQGAMRQYERSGITVDQCADCRGIFLDRGELERLIEAEDAHYGAGAGAAAAPPPPPQGYPQQGYPQQGYPQPGYPPQRPGSFLEQLLGGGGGGHHGAPRRGHH